MPQMKGRPRDSDGCHIVLKARDVICLLIACIAVRAAIEILTVGDRPSKEKRWVGQRPRGRWLVSSEVALYCR